MSFADQLRKDADPIFQAIFEHPFVKGIAEGKLTKEQIIHYLEQDHQFLTASVQLFGIAVSKCESREDMAMFHQRMGFTLHEYNSHDNLRRIAGVTLDDLKQATLAPAANHYISYLFKVAHQGTAGEILAAFLPCPWTYFEIGQKLVAEVQPTPDHPFHDWITFYGTGAERLPLWLEQLERFAAKADDAEKQRMRHHFLVGCQLEYMFWDMAYNVEKWPVPGLIGKGAR